MIPVRTAISQEVSTGLIKKMSVLSFAVVAVSRSWSCRSTPEAHEQLVNVSFQATKKIHRNSQKQSPTRRGRGKGREGPVRPGGRRPLCKWSK